jgi:hypothetical protein
LTHRQLARNRLSARRLDLELADDAWAMLGAGIP